MTGPAESTLDGLVADCLDQMEKDGLAALEVFCERHPEHADTLRARVQILLEAGMLLQDASEESIPERLGEFRLIERIGAGGMGVVYRAVQETLGREVALKLVRPDHLYFPGARERFQREVEAVARLQHPGIVPVYTVGEERSIPYFAMECIEGASLADVLEELHGASPEHLDGTRLAEALARRSTNASAEPDSAWSAGTWTELCLRIVRDAAVALGHAHGRGVHHRDLKPSNLLLSHDGAVRLVDFGLSSTRGGDRLTRTGSVLGSLPYMAPEQVNGKVTDERSDVYSLGVTLFELLTLRVPYKGASFEDTTRAILAGETPSPRALNPSIARDAETVCLKAMERDPGRRYASAQAFARDLDNVLALRPIEARRASAALRARRWMQRHPAWAVGSVTGVLIVVVGPLAFALQQRAAGRRLEAVNAELALAIGESERQRERAEVVNAELVVAVEESERQRERAEANFSEAVRALDQMLGASSMAVAQNPEVGSDFTDELQLVTSALELHGRLVEQLPESQDRLIDRARLLRVRADAYGLRGEVALAEADYRTQIADLRQAMEMDAGNTDVHYDLAGGLGQLANLLRYDSDSEEVVDLYMESADLFRFVSEEDPDDQLHALTDLSTVISGLGWWYSATGRFDEAIEAYAESEALAVELQAIEPANHRHRDGQLYALLGWAIASYHKADREGARELFETVEAKAAEFPRSALSDPQVAQTISDSAQHFGILLLEEGELVAAEEQLSKGLEMQLALRATYRDVVYYQEAVGSSLRALGTTRLALGRLAEAEENLREADEIHEQRLAANPNSTTTAQAGESARALGDLLLHNGDLVGAAERFDRALTLLGAALEESPEHPEFAQYLGAGFVSRARLYIAEGRLKRARADLERAAELTGDRPPADLARAWAEFAAAE